MKWLKIYRKLVILTPLFLLPNLVLGLPQYETTTLPFPDKMDPEDEEMAIFIAFFSVYQDHADKNQYYYVPEFKARNYQEGSAKPFIHKEQVSLYPALKKVIKKRFNLATEEVIGITAELSELRHLQKQAVQNGETEKASAFAELIKNAETRQKKLATRAKEYNQLLPNGVKEALNIYALELLALGGIEVTFKQNDLSAKVAKPIMSVLKKLGKSYGGYFAINIYGELTKEQANYLRKYKQKYFPHIKLSALPITELDLDSLTELQFDSDGKAVITNGISIFRKFKGEGDFRGATLNFDLTVAGASSFATNPSPFIVPVEIIGTFKQKAKPFEARLQCDFSTGWNVKGRADIRDGLVIYNNDLTNEMIAHDTSEGGCKLDLIKGDRRSAEVVAMKTLEKELMAYQMKKTRLSIDDKMAYFNAVQKDIQSNRHKKANDGLSRIYQVFLDSGFGPASFIHVVDRLSNFYWHTNIQDIEVLSKFKLDKHIKMDGHETLKLPLPTAICLAYNRKIQAYKPCTEEHRRQAKPLNEAVRKASDSYLCRNADAVECGEKRAEEAPADSEGDLLPEI
jgi:hypothetical protein